MAKACIFAVFFEHSIEKYKVKNMKLKNIQLSRPTQSWIKRRDRKPQIKVDLHSELRDWVQYVIMEAEKNRLQEERSVPKPSRRSEYYRGRRRFVICRFQRV